MVERASCPFHFRTDYPNPGHEAKHKSKSAPNTELHSKIVDGEMGRWGDGEMGRWGDGEIGGR
ncbi:hypothetical protein [Moorena sp. SIO4A5]|uniref:hypothetical protein n=1 Tax=Moorena sp. SIO4A5 TaxID=2607838 RepID=UPI0025E40822|nr:hypothetical protein [Moorena sp. SIO4A5]